MIPNKNNFPDLFAPRGCLVVKKSGEKFWNRKLLWDFFPKSVCLQKKLKSEK